VYDADRTAPCPATPAVRAPRWGPPHRARDRLMAAFQAQGRRAGMLASRAQALLVADRDRAADQDEQNQADRAAAFPAPALARCPALVARPLVAAQAAQGRAVVPMVWAGAARSRYHRARPPDQVTVVAVPLAAADRATTAAPVTMCAAR
jgi:hypothetical protein